MGRLRCLAASNATEGSHPSYHSILLESKVREHLYDRHATSLTATYSTMVPAITEISMMHLFLGADQTSVLNVLTSCK